MEWRQWQGYGSPVGGHFGGDTQQAPGYKTKGRVLRNDMIKSKGSCDLKEKKN
ncbi:Na+/solute symporter [Leptospira ryugenii]|uniref:Na+/solute symporter n=1 Tax=Leptospira ryugenii TaxID=1917863 RepID=A0A2P2DYF2_9LEPT|nr:Na+/solute symporter [Leptospira ryugenii]